MTKQVKDASKQQFSKRSSGSFRSNWTFELILLQNPHYVILIKYSHFDHKIRSLWLPSFSPIQFRQG